MKLTARKKNILWGIILLILLIIITVIVLSTSVSQKEELSLKQVRTQAVSEVQNSLNNKSVKMADLLTKMKEQQILSSGAKELKDCFEKVDSLDKLNDLKKKVLTIVNNLSTTPGPDNPTPSPGPTGPNNPPSPSPQPPQPNPIPNPQPQPENKWQKILREIREFMESNPSAYQKIKDWLDEKKYSEPLAGIDLKGVGVDELKKLPSGPKAPSDFEEQSDTSSYKDWVQLPAAGDGNCFLHSYAVFLTGKSDLELTQRLRVAICLEIMKNPGKYFSWSDDWILSKLKEVILKDDFTFDGRWLESPHAEYLAHVLKRPLVVISKIPESLQGSVGGKYQCFKYPDYTTYAKSSSLFIPETSSEPWVIYNSGGHFQPLISKFLN